MHLAVYRRRPEVGLVVHTHLLPTEENRYYGIGQVRTAPPALSGSAALDVARVVERQAEIAWIMRRASSH